jgi:hypothetical protein
MSEEWFHIRKNNTISYTRIILVSHAKNIKIHKQEGFIFCNDNIILIFSVSRKFSSRNAQELKLGTCPIQLIYIKKV